MTPGTINAIALLLTEAIIAGNSIATILAEAKATGKVPPEQWAAIMAEIRGAEALWEAAMPAPRIP